MQGLELRVRYKHVRSHMDEILREDQMSLQEKINLEVDKKADESLRRSVQHNTAITPTLPYE